MKIIKKRLEELKEAPYNPRRMSDFMKEKLQKSLETFGYVDPIIWNAQTGHVVGGNQRLIVMRSMYDANHAVEVVEVSIDLTKEKALNAALNKITGEWEEDKLAQLLKDIEEDQPELVESMGFTPEEVDNLKVFDDEYKKEGFDDIVEKFDSQKGKTDKNENWFFIEYYKDNEKYAELCRLLSQRMIGNSKHELDSNWFFELVQKAVADGNSKK